MIKFLHSGMAGAPGLTNAAGALVGVLDAVLVNGFNERTASALSVTSSVATATLPSGHGFEIDSVVLVAGATPSELNGEKRVTGVTAEAITFASTSPNGAATGTITVRCAPLGWEKAFSGTGAAAYRSTDPTSTQMFLSVSADTAAATVATVYGYEAMSSATVGTGPFPSTASGVSKSPGAAARWLFVGDSKTFYLLHQHVAGGNFASGSIWGFGDFVSFSTVDPHRCFLAARISGTSSSTLSTVAGTENQSLLDLVDSDTAGSNIAAPRSRSGVAGAVSMVKTLESYMATNALVVSGGTTNPGGAAFATYPAPANQGLILSRVVLAEGGGPRGYLRGFYGTPQNCHASFNQMDRVQGQGAFAGRKLMALKCGSPAGTVSQGVVFVDITGPWES
jgi:hypothetical protein